MKQLFVTVIFVLFSAGCSKTAVVLDENGIITAVTEAPTFRQRNVLIDETSKIVDETCRQVKELNHVVEFEVKESSDNDSPPKQETDRKIFEDIKEVFELVENVLDLVPSHSVSVSLKCSSKNEQAHPPNKQAGDPGK